MYQMNGRGGCCTARHTAGGGIAAYDMSKVDRIMLRFRPIAPKPPPTEGGSVSPTERRVVEPFTGAVKGKSKYLMENDGVNKLCNSNRKRKASSCEYNKKTESVVTLPLFPYSPTKSSQPGSEDMEVRNSKLPTTWPRFDDKTQEGKDKLVLSGGPADRKVGTMPHQEVKVLGSSVTVERVTETWVDADGLGSTDGERKVNLGRDTCPGFISDEFGRVTWTNEAYKKMVVGQGEGEEMVVGLVMKVPVTVTPACQAFTCRVRVQSWNSKEKSSLITLPCDAWRMDGGGFAWRLDVNAALSLGR